MKVRILSDLHIDYNERFPTDLRPSRMFTIFAGDTSGDPKITIETVRRLATRGLIIAGNHIVYNDRKKTIQDLRMELHEAFHDDCGLEYLDATVTGCPASYYHNGVLFIGSTMYTDYKLKTRHNLTGNVSQNMWAAQPKMSGGGMNDFHWGRCDDPTSSTLKRYMDVRDYQKWNAETVERFESILEINEASSHPSPVVMITHHAPLKQCLSSWDADEFLDNTQLIDASYASDMSEFIEKHRSIKAWIYGHTHWPKVFEYERKNKRSKVLMINNAHGYANYFENAHFFKNLVLDTDTWTVTKRGKIPQRKFNLKKLSKEDLAILSCFV